jgi:hypothetical protein
MRTQSRLKGGWLEIRKRLHERRNGNVFPKKGMHSMDASFTYAVHDFLLVSYNEFRRGLSCVFLRKVSFFAQKIAQYWHRGANRIFFKNNKISY